MGVVDARLSGGVKRVYPHCGVERNPSVLQNGCPVGHNR